jgi:PhnB protein
MPELDDLDLETVLRDLPRPAFKQRLRESMEPQTIVPYITVNDVERLIAFVKEAFDAEELVRGIGSAGGTHCEVRIGDSRLMLGGGGRGRGPEMTTMLHVYVPDVDAMHQRAVAAGGKSLMSPVDQGYGERDSVVEDPTGNQWCLATSHGAHYKPDAMRTVTMYLHPHGVERLIDFVDRAFGAQTLERHASPDGVVQHAKVKIGNSIVEMGEAHGEWQPMPTMIYFIVDDPDGSYEHALTAGATSVMTPRDQPYGARMAGVEDPTGNQWYMAAPLRSA